ARQLFEPRYIETPITERKRGALPLFLKHCPILRSELREGELQCSAPAPGSSARPSCWRAASPPRFRPSPRRRGPPSPALFPPRPSYSAARPCPPLRPLRFPTATRQPCCAVHFRPAPDRMPCPLFARRGLTTMPTMAVCRRDTPTHLITDTGPN